METLLLDEMLAGQWPALARALPFASAAAVALAVLWPRLERLPVSGRSRCRQGLLLLASLLALALAWRLAWLSDDSFISFRYAENLVAGHGLVFNPGERVEGYTNFLWTLALAAAHALGASTPHAALALGLLSYTLLPWVTDSIVRRLSPAAAERPVPLAALAVAASYSLNTHATSGLETITATLLAALALERALASRPLASGLAGIAATLCHPDHGLLYAGLGLSLLLRRAPLRSLLRYALPFLLVFLPYFAWRTSYYGDLFPNTYYAKSGGLAYYEQGVLYLASWLLGSNLWLLLPLSLWGLRGTQARPLRLYSLCATLPFVVYVAKIGGDFMHARLLCVLMPSLLAAAELGVSALLLQASPLRRGVCALPVLLLAVPPALFLNDTVPHVTDEERHYRVQSLSPLAVDSHYFRLAKDLQAHAAGMQHPPLVAIDCVGMTGYFSGLPILDRYGLTDREVAHLPLLTRGRPGHEKRADPALLHRRGAHLCDVPVYPQRQGGWGTLRLGQSQWYVVNHEPRVMQELARVARIRLPDPGRRLAQLQAIAPHTSAEALACDAWQLDAMYVARWGSPQEQAQLNSLLMQASAPKAHRQRVKELAPSFIPGRTHEAIPEAALHFELAELRGAGFEGSAFATGPRSQPVPGQRSLGGHQGALLNSFGEHYGDEAQGSLTTPPFPIVGDVIQLWVGGGRALGGLQAQLLVEGEEPLVVGGCDSEILGRRLFWVGPLRGKQARLRVRDDRRGPWAHILVDELSQWRPLGAQDQGTRDDSP